MSLKNRFDKPLYAHYEYMMIINRIDCWEGMHIVSELFKEDAMKFPAFLRNSIYHRIANAGQRIDRANLN